MIPVLNLYHDRWQSMYFLAKLNPLKGSLGDYLNTCHVTKIFLVKIAPVIKLVYVLKYCLFLH